MQAMDDGNRGLGLPRRDRVFRARARLVDDFYAHLDHQRVGAVERWVIKSGVHVRRNQVWCGSPSHNPTEASSARSCALHRSHALAALGAWSQRPPGSSASRVQSCRSPESGGLRPDLHLTPAAQQFLLYSPCWSFWSVLPGTASGPRPWPRIDWCRLSITDRLRDIIGNVLLYLPFGYWRTAARPALSADSPLRFGAGSLVTELRTGYSSHGRFPSTAKCALCSLEAARCGAARVGGRAQRRWKGRPTVIRRRLLIAPPPLTGAAVVRPGAAYSAQRTVDSVPRSDFGASA